MKIKHSTVHNTIIALLILVVILTTSTLYYIGNSYYSTSLEERHFHPENDSLIASGPIGHGLGVIGSLMMAVGLFTYMARKRIRFFSRVGVLKYWLEMHIFLCTLGPVLVLFHTTFKFGGIVAISFWCMVAVVLSGVIGRFIYIQIPRSIEGREFSLQELEEQKRETNKQLRKTITLDESIYELLDNYSGNESKGIGNSFFRSSNERGALRQLKTELKLQQVPKDKTRDILQTYKDQLSLKKRIDRLTLMQDLFKYWHVAHLPFALGMLVIMIVHVTVAITFGAKWIF
ncbi:MAG: hypothetical protein WCP85_21310 [Mariniphaga sp.]